MAEVNKCSVENMLSAIVGVVNTEQNSSFPATIFTSQYNTVISVLLSKLSDIYPSDSSVLDIIDPYVERKVLTPVDGYITLPDNFRNILGTPQISATDDGCSECLDTNVSNKQFQQLVLKSGCKKVPLLMVDQTEFAFRTTSTYKKPTYDKPIGYRSGKLQIKVCPFNIRAVEVMYVRKEGLVNYGYTMQPDDTFVYDAATSVDPLFTSAAFNPIFSALLSLYSAFTRDNSIRDWAVYINEKGLI
jgi:hypothetical protein